jgi:hypothetical protein
MGIMVGIIARVEQRAVEEPPDCFKQSSYGMGAQEIAETATFGGSGVPFRTKLRTPMQLRSLSNSLPR